jgi:predicted GNAT family N-acyltransferase
VEGEIVLIQGKILSYGDDLAEVFQIRRTVFVEEQKIPDELEFDDLDHEAMHVIVYEEDPNWRDTKENYKKAVATGRILFDGTTCKIGRIAVLKEHRNMKYGDFTVRMLLNKAFTAGINEVSLDAQCSAQGFYEKIGFHEAGIIHIPMVIHMRDIITSCKKA